MSGVAGGRMLGGGLAARTRAGLPVRGVRALVRRGLGDTVREAVVERDRHVCRFCGFRALRYQQVALLDGDDRSLDGMVTACIFCRPCFHLELAVERRSGVLLRLPELSQTALHDLARDLYRARITQGVIADRARRALKHLMTRREGARERLGTDDPAHLLRWLEGDDDGAAPRSAVDPPPPPPPADLDTALAEIRLFPLDRRIVREGDLEFNQFPQILAYWRSRNGPYAGIRRPDPERIDRYLVEVAGVAPEELEAERGEAEEAERAAEAERAEARARSGAARGKGRESRRASIESQYEKGAGRPETGEASWEGEPAEVATPPTTPLGLAWVPADEELRAGLARRLRTVDEALDVDAERSRFEVAPLPFYDGIRLVSIRDDAWPDDDVTLYYLVRPRGRPVRLDGNSPPIHQLNARAPIRIGEDTVFDYLRFFCFFVRGEEGPFHLRESLEEPLLPGVEKGTARTVLEASAEPLAYYGRDARGHLLCDGVVFYSNALFQARFAVFPSGMVEMRGDDPIAADLPVRMRTPISYASDPEG